MPDHPPPPTASAAMPAIADELERLHASMTPAPWRECGHGRGGCACRRVWSTSVDVPVLTAFRETDDEAGPDHPKAIANAAAVARVRTLLPDIIAALRAAAGRAADAASISGTTAPAQSPHGLRDLLYREVSSRGMVDVLNHDVNVRAWNSGWKHACFTIAEMLLTHPALSDGQAVRPAAPALTAEDGAT